MGGRLPHTTSRVCIEDPAISFLPLVCSVIRTLFASDVFLFLPFKPQGFLTVSYYTMSEHGLSTRAALGDAT